MWKFLEALFAVLFYLFAVIFSIYGIYVGIGGLLGRTIGAIIIIIATGWLIAATIVAMKKGLKESSASDNPSDPTVKDEQDTLSG